jgi:hypothetical protein
MGLPAGDCGGEQLKKPAHGFTAGLVIRLGGSD